MLYTWLIITILLSIIEMLTVNLVCIWYIISSLLALIVSIFTDNVMIQMIVFVLGGTLLLILTKDVIKKIMPVKTKTNIDRIIGMKGKVTDRITKEVLGEVKVDGKLWSAKADETIEVGETVVIKKINSTKLLVEKENDK